MSEQGIARWFRLSLMFAGLFLAFGAFVHSNAMNLRRAAPQIAYSLYRDNPGVIAARYNDLALKGKQLQLNDDDQRELRKALVGDPLNRTLVRSLAVWHDVNREPSKALKGMQLSSAVSRRDIITQLWLVEYWLRHSNPDKAYRHIDRSLKLRPEISALLYPRLNTLLGHPGVAAQVELAAKSDIRWVPGFADYLALKDPTAAYALLTRPSVMTKSANYISAYRSLAHHLARAGAVDRAITVAKAMLPQDRYDEWASVGLNLWSADARFGDLSWVANPDYASLAPNDEKELELQALVPSDQTVELMRRGIFLLPGSPYQLQGTVRPISDLGDTKLQWILACWSLSGEKWYHIHEVNKQSMRRFSLAFEVPLGCPYTKIILQSIGPTSAIPAEFSLSSLNIKNTKPL